MAMTAATSDQMSSTPARQAALPELVAMELFKLRKRPMTYISLGLLLASVSLLPALIYTIIRATGNTDDFASFLLPEVIPSTATIISVLGSILLVVIAAGIIGSEYSWSTVRVVVGSGASRTLILTAKLLALLILILLFVVASMLLGVVTGAVLALIGGHDLSFDWLTADAGGDMLLMLIGTTFQLIVSAVIGFVVAVVTRSLAAGIAVGIGYSIVESIIGAILSAIGGVGETISRYLLTTNSNRIASVNTFDTPVLSDNAPGLVQAFVVLTLYSVILLALAYLVFRRRDIPSGS